MKKINHGVFGFLFSVLLGVMTISPLVANAAAEIDITAESRSDAELIEVVAKLEAQLAALRTVLAERITTTSAAGFSIQINETFIPVAVPATRQAAQASCEKVAYAPAHMWQLVTCTYNGEVLYRDVFIAG
jgi:hypothetical protein